MIKKNLYILFLLASVSAFAQVNLYSEVSTQDAHVNSPITFTVVLEIVGEDLEQESPLKLPDFSKFNYAVSSEQKTFIDPVKKIRMNQMVYQFLLDPKQTGNIKIGSALVKINGKMYKTEPIDIVVKEPEKKSLANTNNPAKNMYLNMQVEEKEVYKNEPVIAVIRAYSKNISSFRHLEPAKFEPAKNFSIRSIANVDESIEDADNDFSSQIIAMFVIVPKIAGFMDIPAVDVPINKHNLVSNKVKINVKKLPEGAPENYKNAVGKYNLSIELIDKNKESFEIDKAFNISVKVSGNGNLSPQLLPKILPSPDYEIFDSKVINASTATNMGIEGEVEAQYVIIPKKRGDLKISTEDFSYFDPKEEKYVDIGSKSLELNAVNSQDIANAKTTLQKVNEYTNTVLEKVDSPVISTEKLKVKEHKKINWKVIFGNLLIVLFGSLIFIYFNKKYKENKRKELEKKKKSTAPIVTIAETEAMLRSKDTIDLKPYFDDLKNNLNDDSDSGFFKSFEELKQDVDQYCYNKYQLDFLEHLRKDFGLESLEKYNRLITKVNIEKYSPVASKENQKEILKEIEEVYNLL